MNLKFASAALLLTLAVTVGACSKTDEVTPGTDAAPAEVNETPEGATDATKDATPEGATDATKDATPEGATEAVTDETKPEATEEAPEAEAEAQ